MVEPMPGTVAWHPRRGTLEAAPLDHTRSATERIELHPGIEVTPFRWERLASRMAHNDPHGTSLVLLAAYGPGATENTRAHVADWIEDHLHLSRRLLAREMLDRADGGYVPAAERDIFRRLAAALDDVPPVRRDRRRR